MVRATRRLGGDRRRTLTTRWSSPACARSIGWPNGWRARGHRLGWVRRRGEGAQPVDRDGGQAETLATGILGRSDQRLKPHACVPLLVRVGWEKVGPLALGLAVVVVAVSLGANDSGAGRAGWLVAGAFYTAGVLQPVLRPRLPHQWCLSRDCRRCLNEELLRSLNGFMRIPPCFAAIQPRSRILLSRTARYCPVANSTQA